VTRRIALLAVIALTLAVSACYDEIDRCLDAGGRWNHERSECEFGD
jgi:hypothetical protein